MAVAGKLGTESQTTESTEAAGEQRRRRGKAASADGAKDAEEAGQVAHGQKEPAGAEGELEDVEQEIDAIELFHDWDSLAALAVAALL